MFSELPLPDPIPHGCHLGEGVLCCTGVNLIYYTCSTVCFPTTFSVLPILVSVTLNYFTYVCTDDASDNLPRVHWGASPDGGGGASVGFGASGRSILMLLPSRTAGQEYSGSDAESEMENGRGSRGVVNGESVFVPTGGASDSVIRTGSLERSSLGVFGSGLVTGSDTGPERVVHPVHFSLSSLKSVRLGHLARCS